MKKGIGNNIGKKYDSPIKINKDKDSKHRTKMHEECKDGVITDEELSDLFVEMTSNLYVLAIKLKGFHWNVIGNQFFPMHVLLDEQVGTLLGFADESAEIIRQINDAPAPISMLMMVKKASLIETRAFGLVTTDTLLPVVLTDYNSMIEFCDKVIKISDKAKRQDLSDFCIGVRQYLDKYKWQFKSANK